MIVRRTLDGAEKCALRDFLREELMPVMAVSIRYRNPNVVVSYWC